MVPNLSTKIQNTNTNPIFKDTTSPSLNPSPILNHFQKQNEERAKKDDLKQSFENQIEDPLTNWTIDTMDWRKQDSYDGTTYLLRNGHGKCMAVSSSDPKLPPQNGSPVVQLDCNPSDKGQLWSWKKKRLLCNNWDKCLTVIKLDVVLWEYIEGELEKGWYQTWSFFQNDLNSRGLCALPAFNSVANEAKMVIEICANKKKGKSWNFYKEVGKNQNESM